MAKKKTNKLLIIKKLSPNNKKKNLFLKIITSAINKTINDNPKH